MQSHGPDPLAGPLRGTSAWWHGRAPDADPPAETPPPETPAETPRRKRAPRKIRVDLVNRVKAEIAAGTYDTADKFHEALERLLERMGE